MVAEPFAPVPASPLSSLWAHIYGDQIGFLCVFAGRREQPGSKRLADVEERFYAYPQVAGFAEGWIEQRAARGLETYTCGHLLTDKRRRKESAGTLHAAYVDGDGAQVPPHLPPPTATVRSSPGREQFYWRYTRAVPAAVGEALNRRFALAMGADQSGWDLTQLLRPPGSRNHKYPDTPPVELVELRDEAYDPDELDRLLPPLPVEPAARPFAAGSAGPAAPVSAEDEPPVRLDPAALAWWTGARTAPNDAGETDRSKTLYAIACHLARAGATARTVGPALADRDEALGLHKYTGRRDAATQYERLAVKALREVAQEPPRAAPGASVADEDLRRENAALRSEVRQLREERSLLLRVWANPHIKAPARTAVAALFDYAAEQSRGALDAEGFSRSPQARIAERAGASPKRVGAHLDQLDEWGVFTKRVERNTTRVVDAAGEVAHRPYSITRIKPAGTVNETLAMLATLEPERPQTWGGKRLACPDHPDAGTITRTTVECAECGTVLQASSQFRPAADLPDTPAAPPRPVDRAPLPIDGPGDWAAIMAAPLEDDETPAVSASSPVCVGEPLASMPTLPVSPPAGVLAPIPLHGRERARLCLSASRGCRNRVQPGEEYCPACVALGYRNARPLAAAIGGAGPPDDREEVVGDD